MLHSITASLLQGLIFQKQITLNIIKIQGSAQIRAEKYFLFFIFNTKWRFAGDRAWWGKLLCYCLIKANSITNKMEQIVIKIVI